ncbi:titin isoform X2 [Condylostylus longicornis]|uniref:titin isoform X2 n=1 Tax=Condylostylus longicornis TaxID=2530218 RepID=UPI00244DA790|nr:titin isoform X2 [Condylostylus longicornis]
MDGVSLADQSYQSFKNKEIRDSESPTGDGGFVQKAMRNINSNDGVIKPNTSGWNITSSSTVNPDGSGYKNESLATTEGSRKIAGGQHEFAGINQHMEKASHYGDDKNFVKSAAESSNTKLQESTVVGDEKSGRIEKKSSTVVSSSSKSFSQKQTTSGNMGDFDPNLFGIDRPSGQFPAILERRDSTQSNATDYSTRSNTNQSLKEKLAMTRQNVESRSTSSIREEEFHHQTQSKTSSSKTNQQQQIDQQEQQQHRHYEIGGKHHLRETDNYEREHQRYQDELERKLAQEISQQQRHHNEQKSSSTTTEHATSHQQHHQQKILRQSENISREEQQKQHISKQQNTTSAIDGIDERYLTKYTDNTGTTIKKSGVINKDSPPELQAQFEKLKAQPGRIISEEISYPKPGVKMITTKKELSDGTVVTTRDYETKTPNERVVQEKVIAGNTERSQHVKYNTNTEKTDRQFTKSIDQRNQQILRNTDATDSSDRTSSTRNRDVTDHSRVRHDDYVEKIRDAVETLDINKTVKKDLSRTMRDENLTQADFVETDRGCVLIDRNTGRPERYTTSDVCDRNAALREERQEYEYQTKDVRQQKFVREDDTQSTHGFPSQRVPDENRHPGEKIHKIYKDEDGFRGTHGFPSARSPDTKSQYSTSSTTKEHYEQTTRSNQHDEDFRGTHGFPSARTPGDSGDHITRRSDFADQYPQKSTPRDDDFLGTHGFPSTREPSGRYSPSVSSELSEHYEKRTQKTDESFLGTHGFPSARAPDDRPYDRQPTSPGAKSKQPVGPDFRGTHGFPSVAVDKNERQTRVETQQQQFTTQSTVKHVDAAHEAFARSLRCVSPIDNTRRGSNASQRSYRTNTHGSTRSHDSPARERSVLSDSSHVSSGTVTKGTTTRTPTKHHSKEVHHSNETIDLPSKTIHTKTTTTKATSHDATPGFTRYSPTTSPERRSTKTIPNAANKTSPENKSKTSKPIDKGTCMTTSTTTKITTKTIRNESPQNKIDKEQPTKSSYPTDEKRSESPINHEIDDERNLNRNTRSNTSRRITKNIDNTEEIQSNITKKTKSSPTRNQSPSKSPAYDSPKSSRKSSPTKQGPTSREPSPNQKPTSTKKVSTITTKTKTTKGFDDKLRKPERQPSEPEFELDSPGSGYTTSDFEFVRVDDTEVHNTHRTETNFNHSKHSAQPVKKASTSPHESGSKHSPHLTRKTTEKTFETSSKYSPQPVQKFPNKPKDIDFTHSPQLTRKIPSKPHESGSPERNRKFPEDSRQLFEPSRDDSEYGLEPSKGYPEIETGPESSEPTEKPQTDKLYRSDSSYSPQPTRKSPEKTHSKQSPNSTRKSPEKTISTIGSTSTGFTKSQKTDNAIYRDSSPQRRKPSEPSKAYIEDESEPENEPAYHDTTEFIVSETTDTQDGIIESKQTQQKTDTFTRQKKTQEFIDSERFDAEFPQFDREPSPINENIRPRSTSKDYQAEIEKITQTSPGTRKFPQQNDKPEKSDYYKEMQKITNDTTFIDETNVKSSNIVSDHITDEHNRRTYVTRGDIPIEPDDEEEPRQPFFLKEPINVDENVHEPTGSKPKGLDTIATNDTESKNEYPKEIPKSKTPFTRSETFEERCRQMLGISDTSEKTTSKKHQKTTEFITNERRYQDSFLNRKSSSSSPVPSPRSTSPQKMRDSDVKITVTTTENVTKTNFLEKESYSDVDSIKTRSASPSPVRRSKAPTRETSPSQRPDHPEVSLQTVTKKSNTDSLKDTYSSSPYDSPYSRSPDSSPIRRPGTDSAYSRSPDSSPVREHIKTIQTTTVYEKTKPTSKETSPVRSSKTTKTRTTDKEKISLTTNSYEISTQKRNQSPVQPKHITTARIEISPTSVRKTLLEKNTSPTRKPTESRKPYETSPTRKPIDTSPTRRAPISHKPYESSPTRESTKPSKPHDNSPGKTSPRPSPFDSSPTRKTTGPNKREESPLRKSTESTKPYYESPTRKTTESRKQYDEFLTSISEPIEPNFETPIKIHTEPLKPLDNSTTAQLHEMRRPRYESPTRKSTEQTSTTRNKLHEVTKGTTSITSSRIINKGPSPSKDSPRKPKEKEIATKPTIRKKIVKRESLTTDKITRGDIEVDESDVLSDDENILIIETTSKVTDTKKSTPAKKYPVTERKESAPVSRTTQIDRDTKFTRSTSDNIFKTSATKRTLNRSNETPNKTKPVESPKLVKKQPSDQKRDKNEKRPSKCLTTKTINLTTANNILNSEEMENVVIDIQQAKSSREPSPNKIVPVPVSASADDDHDGFPRYPDEVQEPEDSRRTPKVRNIPIFQESLNDFVGCQITEIKETDDCIINERRQQNINVTEEDNFTKNSKMRDTIRTSATIVDDKVDENCLLSVHEKVHKFINTAEEIKKPKTSSPFKRDLQEKEQYPVDDECLLSVNDKVNKFLSTAEKVTKDVITSSGKRVVQRLNVDEIDENLRNDECVLSVSEKVNKFINTAERLVESVPQKSPNLVAQIDRQISKQSEDERNFEPIKKQPYEPVATYIPNGSPYDHEDYSKTKKGEPKYPRDRSTSPITKPQKSKPSQPRGSLISNEITVNKTVTQKSKVTDRYAPNKPKEITRTTSKPVIKTTETVRKAKSVFENGDVKTTSRTTTSTSNNSKQRDIISRPSVFEAKRNREPSDVKLKDIGVRKTTKENDLNRPEPKLKDDRPHKTKPVSSFQSTKNSVTDSVSSRKNVFEQCTILSTNDIGSAALEVTERLSKSTPRRKSGAESPTRRTVPESPHRRQPSAEYSRKPAIVTEATVTTSTRKVQSPAKFNNAEDTDGYVDKSKTTSQKKVPLLSKSPTRDGQDSPIPATKKVFESNTEYIDEYTDKYQKVEKNHYSRKDSSSTISTKKISDKNEQYDTDTMVSRKPTDSILSDLSPQGIKPVREETFTTTTTTTRRGDESPSVLARKNIFESPDVKLNGYSSPIQKPSYMDHTKSSLEHIRRDSLEINRTNYQRKTSFDEETFENNPKSAVKFGVHLKHNASEYKPRRKSSSSEIPHIEEIFDLELLEQMLSTVVGYEQRRRIRSQIRIVKKLIEQKKREETQIAYIRETSPARRSTPSSPRSPSPTIRVTTRRREDITKKSEEEQVAYIRETSPARKSPVREQTQNTPRRDATKKSPVRNATKTTSIHDGRQTSPVRESRVERTSHKEKYSKGSSNTNFIDHESKHIEKHESYTRERSISPKSKVKTVTTITEIRKVGGSNIPDKSITTKKVVQSNTNEKPIWATKNILKKASESDRSAKVGTTKKIQSSSTTRTSHTQQKDKKVSDEDVITSSYGIGPTDEDGRPLFGLRALKTKKPAESSKVTGTIVSESFYSENGHAPVGERKITVYSTDPNDIDEYEANYDNKTRSDSIKRESCQRDGLTSVTRTQKFGDGNKFDTRDVESLNDTIEFDGSTKVRRGSVKEMSEKFIRKESSSSVTEKTSSSSYPKAGLILRTKTKESSPTTSRYRAGSYEDEEYESAGHEYESSTTRHESKTRSIHESESETESIKISKAKSSTSTRSFLDSSGSKVTGVNDVLERMRNADNIVQDGDSMEDREARALLNKFLGASVLMSGVESMMPAQEVVTTRVTKINTEPVKEVVKTTRVTKTVKSEGNSSTPVSFGTSDIEEVWDEEYLKELLEQSTSYEERRKIRARIKQLMAEREACADIVASVKAELENSQATKKPPQLQHQNSRKTTGIVEVENNDSDDDSSVYEEIIEEIEVTDTDGSDNDNGDEDDTDKNKNIKSVTTTTTKKVGCGNNKTETVVTTTKFVEKTKPKTEIVKTVIKTEPLRTSVTPTKTTTTTSTKETLTKEATPTKITAETKTTKDTDNKQGKNKKYITETDNIIVERVVSDNNDKSNKIKSTSDKQKKKEKEEEKQQHKNEEIEKEEEDVEEEEEEVEKEEEEEQEEDDVEEKGEDLLPLLQGLLHFSSPEKEQAHSRKSNMSNLKNSNISHSKSNSNKTSNTLKTHTLNSNNYPNNMNNKNYNVNNSISTNNNHVEDSGTESGEDLKLLAAGLRDSMQSIKNDTGLIPEVTAALTRLEKSLKEGTSDIQLDLKRRNALLTLVSRLQTGLTSPDKIKEPTPAPNHLANISSSINTNNVETSSPEGENCRGSNRQRFAKRRSRANRHTVGVSREELADARRYMEEMILIQNLSHNVTTEGTSAQSSSENQPSQEQNTAYQKEVSGVTDQLVTPNTRDTVPTTLYRPNQFVPSNAAQQSNSVKIVTPVVQSQQPPVQRRDKKSQIEPIKRQSADYDQTSTNLVQNSKRPLSESYSSTVGQQMLQQQQQQQRSQYQTGLQDQQQQNYYQPESNISNGYHNAETSHDYSESQNRSFHQTNKTENFEPSNIPLNRFSNKKLAMKRANTIDIPKPMKYINDMESDSEAEDYGVNSTKSIGLRGTVQVSVNKPKSFVQAFEPKTENDMKFLAFIQKQGPAPGLAWNNPNRTVSNWTSKFGNIKQAFEAKSFENSFRGKPPAGPISSAKNFWKKNEIQLNAPRASFTSDKITKQSWSDKTFNSKNSAPNSPHHFITSPVHNWAGVKRSTPTSPMTSALPWVSKNRTENRIRSKAEKYDKKSPPPSNLHRQTSLHHQDNAFDQRKKDYGTNLTDMKRPSLPDANDPYIKSSYNAQPTYYASTPHIHNNSHSYEYDNQANQKPEPLIQYQNAQKLHKSQPALEYNPPITDQDYGIMPVSVPVHNEIQEYTPKFRNREDSLTNPNAQPLVLTSSCPTFDPQNTISENHKPLILTNTCSTYDPQNTISESHKYPLKIFDYPSPTTSMASPISYPHHDITTDDEVDSEILTEYKVESKVMTGPVSQQAVTVSANKTQRIGDNGKKSAVAKSLLSTMKNIKAEDRNKGQKQILPQKQIPTPEVCLSPDGRSYQAPQVEPVFPELTKVETNRAPEYLGQPFASQTPSHYQQNPVYVPPQSNLIYNSAETDYQQTLQYQQQLQQNLSQEKKQKEYQEQLQKLEQHQYEEHKQKLEQERLQKEYEKHKKILEQQRLQKEYEEHKKLMEQQRLQKEYEEHKKMLEQQRLQQEYEEHKRLLHQQQIQKEYEQQQIVEQHKIELQKQQQLKNMNSNQQKLQSGNHQYQPSALNNTANGNLYQYSDIQKNLEQHRQIQEAYPKQEQQNFQQYKPTPPARKKSAPKVEPTTPVLNAKSTVPPKFGYSDLKPIKNYSDVSNFAEKSQSVSKSSKIETFNENQKHEIHSSQQTTKQQALKARQRSLEEPTVDEQQNQIILSQKKISSNTEIIKQKAQKKIATQQEIYQTNKKLITEVQEENKGNFTKIVSQKNQQVVEKVEYKSSQPADTPDIVKSSLPKDDIPILKKFGPPQRHLYTPNAYKTPITKCESASNASKMSSTTTSTGRKMSEPSVLAKLQKQQSQPEIIETPATPAAEQEENIEEIIPRNIVFNNVAQFTNMSRRVSESASDQLFNKNIASVKTNNLSKSDSWHQICMLQHQTKPPSPKFGESGVGNQLRRTKSGHTLAVPKMYEGSINRDEVSEKQNIVAAYFSGNKSPNSLSRNSSQTNITDNEKMSLSSSMTSSTFVKKSSINRTRTVDKTSIGKQMPSTGLVRSQTMPHIDKLNLLDESNVEDAFEQILLGS